MFGTCCFFCRKYILQSDLGLTTLMVTLAMSLRVQMQFATECRLFFFIPTNSIADAYIRDTSLDRFRFLFFSACLPYCRSYTRRYVFFACFC